jgi:pentatricopeptide repeat domain-containing protein 1
MIDAYAKSGKFEKAIELFDSLEEDGMRPDQVTYGTILDCYAKIGRHLNEMLDLVKAMRESSVELNI